MGGTELGRWRASPALPPPAQRSLSVDSEGGIPGSERGFDVTPAEEYGEIEADRAVLTRKKEDMRHPPQVWTDPAYEREPLDRLRRDYLEYLRGRAQPTSPETVTKYGKSLLSYPRSVERQAEEPVLGSLTPGTVNAWVREQRAAGRAEDGIASRLGAVKAFSSKFIFKHLELTTRDLLAKVPRITPPEKPPRP